MSDLLDVLAEIGTAILVAPVAATLAVVVGYGAVQGVAIIPKTTPAQAAPQIAVTPIAQPARQTEAKPAPSKQITPAKKRKSRKKRA